MKILLLATAVLAGLSGAAYAQNTATTNGRSTATAIVEGSGSSSGGNGSGRLDNNVDAVAPAIYSNNPCGVGGSGGVSAGGVGLGFGFTRSDDACSRRADAIVLFTAAHEFHDPRLFQWAVGTLCNNTDLRKGDVAHVCDGAGPTVTPEVAQAVNIGPVSSQAQAQAQAQAQPVSVQQVAQNRPDWCYTWSKGDGNEARYRKVCK